MKRFNINMNLHKLLYVNDHQNTNNDCDQQILINYTIFSQSRSFENLGQNCILCLLLMLTFSFFLRFICDVAIRLSFRGLLKGHPNTLKGGRNFEVGRFFSYQFSCRGLKGLFVKNTKEKRTLIFHSV